MACEVSRVASNDTVAELGNDGEKLWEDSALIVQMLREHVEHVESMDHCANCTDQGVCVMFSVWGFLDRNTRAM